MRVFVIKINPKNCFYTSKSEANKNPSFQMNYQITKLPSVSDSFVKGIEKSIKSLPDKWGELLAKNDYKLYCADSIEDVFEKEGLPIEDAPDWDAVTCAHPLFKFFVFTPKVKPDEMQRVVNHEISHGMVDIEGIMENSEFLSSIAKDAYSHKNYETKYHELWNVENLLCRHLDDYRKNEIFADIFAWTQPGGGLWGSGYKDGIKNPNILKENFPTVFKKVSDYEVGIEKHPSLKARRIESYDDDLPLPF